MQLLSALLPKTNSLRDNKVDLGNRSDSNARLKVKSLFGKEGKREWGVGWRRHLKSESTKGRYGETGAEKPRRRHWGWGAEEPRSGWSGVKTEAG